MSADDKLLALVIGPDVKPLGLSANWQTFVFRPKQMQFIKHLEVLKSVHAAALSVGWTEDQGLSFLRSRKFQRYLGCRMQAITTKAAMGQEAWWQFCRDLTVGERDVVEVKCDSCGAAEAITPYEAEAARDDEMASRMSCRQCGGPAQVQWRKESFKPTREQVEGWKEWGSRVEPKTERVHHQFENSEIVFESEDSK